MPGQSPGPYTLQKCSQLTSGSNVEKVVIHSYNRFSKHLQSKWKLCAVQSGGRYWSWSPDKKLFLTVHLHVNPQNSPFCPVVVESQKQFTAISMLSYFASLWSGMPIWWVIIEISVQTLLHRVSILTVVVHMDKFIIVVYRIYKLNMHKILIQQNIGLFYNIQEVRNCYVIFGITRIFFKLLRVYSIVCWHPIF